MTILNNLNQNLLTESQETNKDELFYNIKDCTFTIKISTDTIYSVFETSFKVSDDSKNKLYDATEVYNYLKVRLNSPLQEQKTPPRYNSPPPYQNNNQQYSSPLMTDKQNNLLKRNNIFLDPQKTTKDEASNRINDIMNSPRQKEINYYSQNNTKNQNYRY